MARPIGIRPETIRQQRYQRGLHNRLVGDIEACLRTDRRRAGVIQITPRRGQQLVNFFGVRGVAFELAGL